MIGTRSIKYTTSCILVIQLLSNQFCKKCDDTCEAVKNESFFGMLFIISTFRNYDLIGNQNGTVSLKITDIQGNLTNEIIYKKCLQGQTYRPLPDNDCRGAGTAGDNWGAFLLQYCNANDNSCNLNGKDVSGVNSEIYVSCTGDSTAGLTWYPISWDSYFQLVPDVGKLSKTNLINVFGEIPENSIIWSSLWAGDTNPSKARFITFAHGILEYDFKTNGKFTLCSNQTY